jgi:hypothetical protein
MPTVSFEPLEQVSQFDAENPRDSPQVDQGDVALASFHEADVSLFQLSPLSEFGLCPSQLLASHAEAVADLPEELFIVDGHWR